MSSVTDESLKCVVTGANGFVGSKLVQRLHENNFEVIACTRSPLRIQGGVVVGDINAATNWFSVLYGASVVIHSAARVHIMDDKSADPLPEYRKVNVDGTINLALQAATSGIKRFIFISTVKVNGETTRQGHAFFADDHPVPQDPYAVTKLEAEQMLRELSAQTGMEVVIVRPPLVYGLGVRANFAAMMSLLSRGIPLPLATVNRNRRSMVALDNLVDLLITCIGHPAAANQTFMVSDGEDLSTADLLRRLGQAIGRPARLFPVPVSLLRFGADLIGKSNEAQRLLGSLQVDISKTRELLDWSPKISVDEGLRRAANGMIGL
jgi:nucleoside-diphosphate-sugar epimerase